MKIEVHLGIGYAGANHDDILEIDDSELEGMDKEEIRNYLDECVNEWAWNYIDIGYRVVE